MQKISITGDLLKAAVSVQHECVIRFSSGSICWAVLDTSLNTFIAFENILLSRGDTISNAISQSALMKVTHEQGEHKFGKTIVLFDNSIFTYVPEELFCEKDAKKYLSFTHAFQVNERTGTDDIKKMRSKNVYWMPSEVCEFADRNLLMHENRHFSSVFTGCCLQKNNGSDAVYAYCSENLFYAVAIKGGEIVLSNAYAYATKEDFVFHALNIFRKLDINRQSGRFFISGEMERLPEFYTLISRYINKTGYLSRPAGLKYSNEIGNLPEYFGSVLFEAFTCGS